MAENIEKMEHEKLMRILKQKLEDDGYEVKIENTTEYAGYKADMEAKKDKEILFIEVVNGKEVDTEETKKKWQAISGNRNCDFCLFIKQDKEKEVKKLLEKWAVYYRIIWVYMSAR